MTTYEDKLLAARFAALAPEPLGGDWEEVHGRTGAEKRREGSHASHGRRRRRWEVLAAAAVIVVGGLLVTPALGLGSRLLDLIEGSPARPETRNPVWSPDGKAIAFSSRRGLGNWELHVVNSDGGAPRLLMKRVKANATTAWSPDGRTIAFDDGFGAVYVANADGSRRRLLSRNGHAPSWSPDGRQIALASNGIWVMNADGSEHRRLTRRNGSDGRAGVSGDRRGGLFWSPDGRKLAFLSDAGCGQGCHHLYVVNADGSDLQDLTPRVGGGPGRGGVDPAWSPDGRRIAYVRLDSPGVYIVDPDGRGRRRLTRGSTWRYTAPAWSPDGRKLAYGTDRTGNFEVEVVNADGTGRGNLTRNPAYDGDPVWSPDGRMIAFVSNRDGRYAIYVMNPDGSGQRKLTQGT
jgi:TolB protein